MSARRVRVPPGKAPGLSWFVYVIECADGTLYTGIARDVAARLARHDRGRGARYTRGRGPVRLVYVETAPDRAAALRREHAVRRLPAAAKRRLGPAPAARDGVISSPGA